MTPRELWRQWTMSPTARISFGLVSLLVGLLMLLDLVFKLLPDQRTMTQSLREQVSVNLALQVKRMLTEPELLPRISPMLTDLVDYSKDIRSVGIRKMDGTLVLATKAHLETWKPPSLGMSTLTDVVVPLNTDSGQWGQLEVAFVSPWPTSLLGVLKQPTVQLVVIISITAFVSYYLYLRRVLQHLDPSKAVPERVRVAFDTLTEGLLVLDIDGRVLLVNSAFRGFHPQAGEALLGRSIDQMAWLIAGLQSSPDELPWKRALSTTEPILGVELSLKQSDGEVRRVLLNSAAIRDAAGNARGCLVTLDDVTALDRANSKLRLALSELETSRDQIQKQNDELQMLANCDPMTGCYNRRAFFARADTMMAHAKATGEPLACLMTDIDKFKNFNDTYGHSVGDLVIQQTSRLLKRAMRPQDVLCRYGGEEFCMLLSGMTLDDAVKVAEGIRVAIQDEAGASITEVPNLRITSSFGVAQLGKGGADNLAMLIDHADGGLYLAKESGRNQVQSLAWKPAAQEEAKAISG
jgi:diguanylate cyclase (GGDEF)-like protein/PAS domain S-box-containing protein